MPNLQFILSIFCLSVIILKKEYVCAIDKIFELELVFQIWKFVAMKKIKQFKLNKFLYLKWTKAWIMNKC